MKTITAKQLRSVTVLVRYFIKATGTVVLYIQNDKGVRYYVRLQENGVNTCNCPATVECYHIKAAIKIENARKAEWKAYRAELAKRLAAQYVSTQVVEQIAERLVAPVKTPVASTINQAVEAKEPVKRDMLKAALTTNRGFSLMR